MFDYLIIDESSQVDIIKASICFACARRVVIVGDSCQLSHIVDNESAKLSNQLLARYDIPEAYNYVKYSILDSVKRLYGDRLSVTLLKEHYRCHPDIIAFCNKRYYNDELVVMTNRVQDGLSPFKIIETNITTYSNHSNQRQIDETEQYITTKFKDDYSVVGVVSPYRAHANILQSQLPQGCEADTIHKYQGREKDVIIFNTVAGEINKFIDNPNLINVAVSRAVKEFIIIKSKTMDLPHGSNIGDLIRYIYYNFEPEEVKQSGAVCSVFDLLYKEYNRLYSTFYSKNSDIAGSPAEVIMHNLLEELLTEPQFSSIDFIREYYLRDLINDLKDFSADEIEFIRNGSRLDFLLYNKIDRSPILALEVDGVSFHNNATQKERDSKKNHILSILNIPLLRLSTDGKDEKRRIVESLVAAMSNKLD
ncbi:MAG: AAA domain-containing protein [bacterium]